LQGDGDEIRKAILANYGGCNLGGWGGGGRGGLPFASLHIKSNSVSSHFIP